MGKNQNYFAKWLCLVLTFSCINFSDSKLDSHSFFDFERVKNDIFFSSDFLNPNKVSGFNSSNSRQDDLDCLIQLDAIKNGLTNSDAWAMKRKLNFQKTIAINCNLKNFHFECSVLDAWGKFPSSIFEGNLYEFGGYSECFNIKQNAEQYKTQYCLGNLIMDLKGVSLQNSYQNHFHNVPVPNILQSDENPSVKPRMVIPP